MVATTSSTIVADGSFVGLDVGVGGTTPDFDVRVPLLIQQCSQAGFVTHWNHSSLPVGSMLRQSQGPPIQQLSGGSRVLVEVDVVVDFVCSALGRRGSTWVTVLEIVVVTNVVSVVVLVMLVACWFGACARLHRVQLQLVSPHCLLTCMHHRGLFSTYSFALASWYSSLQPQG